MRTISSKVTSKKQIVIPKKLKEKYGILPATAIRGIEKEGFKNGHPIRDICCEA